MKRFFKWLFWLVVAAAIVIGSWFAFNACPEDVVAVPVVESVDTTAVEVEGNLEVVDTLSSVDTTIDTLSNEH